MKIIQKYLKARNVWVMMAGAAILLSLSNCGGKANTSDTSLYPPVSTSSSTSTATGDEATIAAGKTLAENNCTGCHGPKVLVNFTKAKNTESMEKGRMPKPPKSALSAADIVKINAYLASLDPKYK